ncbi:inhibitor of nuclear factor kappa-B kinase-interacting protein isoform X2 [Hoplias malabaricus]|uniref:inhibitor of nuclear factor kappa-B kinase-interacting protein isoform X2 n=1 Tax=Hoplias malabaricus TaxID=27720 RepID=UPI0034638304
MPSSEVTLKHRKGKTLAAHDGETNSTTGQSCRNGGKKDGEQNNQTDVKASFCSFLDLKTVVSILSLGACFVLSWVVLQQNAKFITVEEKYRDLHEQAADLMALKEKLGAVSKKCEDVQVLLESPEVSSPLSHLTQLEQEVSQLRDWSSGLTKQRQKMQEKLATLWETVEQIEKRTTAISSDMTAKVSSVRTDVRRMGGLEGEVEALLTQMSQLEEKVAQAEKHMVKRVGEVLAASIDRMASLKSSTEKNSQNLEQIRRQIPEFSASDKKLSERILALESSRAKLVRTVTFANDLRPKVFTIKRDFAMLEPQLADLTLRIGHLAEDVMKREEDIAQLKESLASLVTARGDLKQAQEELALKSASSDMLNQNDTTLNETD